MAKEYLQCILKGRIAMKKIFKKISKITPITIMNTLALMLVVKNVNAACCWIMYQPKVPEAANKFIKDS